MVMDDPALMSVWNDFTDEPATALRQNLFANLTFSHFILAHSWGNLTDADLLVHAKNLLHSPAFRRYWDATRARKAELTPDSPEGRVFRIFEQAFTEQNRSAPPGSS